MTDVMQPGRKLDESGLEQLLAGLTAVRGGDFSTRLPESGDPLMDQIATVFNGMADQLDLFTSEVTRVAREVGTEGRLGGQADVKGVSGTWKDLTDSVNAMAGNLTGQVRDVAQVATAVAKGDLTQKIQVDARGEILELKETINTMVDRLSAFADEVTRVAREVGTQGNLGGQAVVRGVSGTWKDLTDNVNVMASNLTAQVRSIAQVATAVARGDLSQQITVEAKGEVAALAQAINAMVGTLSTFAGEVTRVAREVGTEGILGGQANVPNKAGTWKDLTDSVNSMATNLTSQVRNIAQVTTAVAQGDLSKKIDVDARGEILELKTTINTMVDQLSAFADEVTRVAREVGSEGRLGGQAEVEGVSGTWKRLTENVNELAGNLTRQVRAIAEVTSAVAAGDLTRSISVEAQGEVAELKDNINAMVQSLRETIQANQQQDWLKSSLARISGMMQGHRDLAVVAELIMDELAPLVGAQHGTFFLGETAGGDTQLRLIAGYGLRADKQAPLQYRLGQSLIGQVAKSKRSIVVADLPEGYVKISSGLGEASPSSLAVLPILFEDQALGVIELAAFTPFTPVQTDFLGQLTETLGVNLNTIVANARTDALLDESQRLTAELQARSVELQAQQDKLQRSNAELEDKAEQLARQNSDIETKNAEIEQARQEIEERAQQLALASKYKSQFLANMSHELRTPLNSLLILARLLAQNPGRNLTAKQVEYANVDPFGRVGPAPAHQRHPGPVQGRGGPDGHHPERFALRALLDDVHATFQPLTAEKGLTFAVEAAAEAPGEMFTDRQRLRQVLGNLLSNAVKFTSGGRVVLRVGLGVPAPDGRPIVAFSVTDTGIGIAPENLNTIFGAFQQGDGTLSRRYGGTGLGLSIAREVAALLGGDITADSELGRGSTFALHVPRSLPGAQEAEADRVDPAVTSGAPTEDAFRAGAAANDGNADPAAPAGTAAEQPRARAGKRARRPADPARLQCASGPGRHPRSGDGARRSAPSRPSRCSAPRRTSASCWTSAWKTRRPSPSSSGSRSNRAAESSRAGPHEGQPGQRAGRLARLGSVPSRLSCLRSLDELRERITLHLSAAQPEHVPARQGARDPGTRVPPQAEGHEALRGEEDPGHRRRHAERLRDHQHARAPGVSDPGRRRAQGRRGLLASEGTDLILMDVMMPEMDGYATMDEIRQMPAFASLPIIAVTARAMQGDREKSLDAGASDYVTKPVDTEELLTCMERWLTARA